MSEALQVAGAIGATVAVGVAILSPSRDHRTPAMAIALLLAAALVTGEAWHGQISDLRDDPAKLAVLLVAGLIALGGLTWLFRRYPIVLPLALIAALPFRIPIDAGGESSNLLIPLYVVIAAGVLQRLVPYGPSAPSPTPGRRSSADHRSPFGSLSGSEAEQPPVKEAAGNGEAGVDIPRPVQWLGIALVVAIVLYAVQSAYSSDVSRAVQNVSFFLVPFAVMFVLLRDAEWSPRLLRGAVLVIAGEAVLFALIGVVQHEVGEIFWNAKVMESNEFNAYFRVNSLFWDPNIYGRYLALAAVTVVAALLWTESRRHFVIGSAAVAVMFAGIMFSFSQTSFFALLAGLVVLCALRWSLTRTVAVCIAAVVAGAALTAFTGALESDSGPDRSLEQTTSGRSTLIEGGLDLARERPLQGYGSGSFAVEFEEDNLVPPGEAAVSHTEPVTVAAEQGILGLAVYAALLIAAIAAIFSGLGRVAPGLGGTVPWGLDAGSAARARAVARFGVAAAFAALLVHTVGYAGFLTDPLAWAVFALASALLVPAAAAGGTEASTEAATAPSPGLPATPG